MDIDLFDKATLIETKRDNIRKAIGDLERVSNDITFNINNCNNDISFTISSTAIFCNILDDELAMEVVHFTEQLLIDKQVSLKEQFDEL